MMLLVNHGHPTFEKYRDDEHLGRLIQPRRSFGSIEKTAHAGIPWAADNDAFGGWDDETERKFLRMLDAIEGLPGCLFVTAPDVVGDAWQTLNLFWRWQPELKRRGLPVALVAQDGFDETSSFYGDEDGDWSVDFDALFIGGTDDFKLGDEARRAVEHAKAYGLWVHMGRVNSLRRITYAHEIGCDSVDGTKFSRFTDAYLAQGIADMKGIGRPMGLFS